MNRINILKAGIPVVVLVLAAAVAIFMIMMKPATAKQPIVTKPPLVRVSVAEAQDLRMVVESQGTVSPRTQSQLVAQVSGEVVNVSADFTVGGFFERSDVLVQLDPFDYRQQVVAAEADLAKAELRLAMEQAESKVAREEWEALNGGEEADPLTLRIPQLEDARASRDAAMARLERARRDLQRTEIKAPYSGRIRAKMVDVGQFVAPGTPIATIYAVDVAEIRLPLPDQDLQYLDLPMAYRNSVQGASQPKVTVTVDFAGEVHNWQGHVVRTEGELDSRTRMIHVIAQVHDPYAASVNSSKPPLAVGMFVSAEIEGRLVPDLFQIDRSALHPGDKIWIADDEDRLRIRDVTVYRRTSSHAILKGGIQPGDRVILTPLEAVSDGMTVRIIDDPAAEVEVAESEGRE